MPSKPGGTGGDGAPPLPGYRGAQQRAAVVIGPDEKEGAPAAAARASGAE